MLSSDLTRYLALRDALGFKFRSQAVVLRSFVAFAEANGDIKITSARVLEWAVNAPSPEQRRNRLLIVRRFAISLHAEDRAHEVPSDGALGKANRRRRLPFIYSAADIEHLLTAAAALLPVGSIRPCTYYTLFGLIAATGMRVSEALGLCLSDITADGIVIEKTKFKKSRLVPVHATTREAIDHYLDRRRAIATNSDALFVAPTGLPPAYPTVVRVFLQLVRSIGLRGAPGQQGPRIHDMRHTAAMELLQAGVDISVIALWLGHESIQTTQVYLHAHIALKEAALAKIKPLQPQKTTRFKPEDQLLVFLEAL